VALLRVANQHNGQKQELRSLSTCCVTSDVIMPGTISQHCCWWAFSPDVYCQGNVERLGA
jgi:hypothetical protein